MSLDCAEVRWLIEHPEALARADELPLTKKSMLADSSAMRAEFGDMGRAVLEAAQARRSTEGKLPSTWVLSSEAAQQATPFAVAQLRAQRLAKSAPGTPVHDVTCSIGTEVAAMTAAGIDVIGSDLDISRLLMARHNAPAPYLQADALTPVTHGRIIVADPARRAGGRRITRPEDLLPSLPDLVAAWPGHEMAIKCAPGLDFSEWEGEVALTSVDGGVKEACLCTPGLATSGVQRSAWVIRDQVVNKYDDAMSDHCPAGPVGAYIVDPDGAVVRAGLVRQYAAAHGLWQLDERIAHLTGDAIPAGESGFEVLAQVPVKKVRQELQARNCGAVEILVRGVDLNPDTLRKQWKLRGDIQLAVIISRIGKSAVAFICGPRQFNTG